MTDATPAAPAASPEPIAEAVAPAVATPSPAVAPEPIAVPVADGAEPAPTVETPKPNEPAAVDVVPAPVDDEKKPEVVAEAPKVEAPKYEFKMPEGVVADAPVMSAYTNILGKYNLAPEAGQELLDFHAQQIKTVGERMVQEQQDQFSKTRQGWVKDFEKQAGNRRDTMLNDAKWAASQFGGDKKQVAELWSVLNFTGAGDHPAVIRAFSNFAKALRERGAPQQGNPEKPIPTDPATRRYGQRA